MSMSHSYSIPMYACQSWNVYTTHGIMLYGYTCSTAAMSNPRPVGRMWPSWRFWAAQFRFSL